jgi:hypothetical protein
MVILFFLTIVFVHVGFQIIFKLYLNPAKCQGHMLLHRWVRARKIARGGVGLVSCASSASRNNIYMLLLFPKNGQVNFLDGKIEPVWARFKSRRDRFGLSSSEDSGLRQMSRVRLVSQWSLHQSLYLCRVTRIRNTKGRNHELGSEFWELLGWNVQRNFYNRRKCFFFLTRQVSWVWQRDVVRGA